PRDAEIHGAGALLSAPRLLEAVTRADADCGPGVANRLRQHRQPAASPLDSAGTRIGSATGAGSGADAYHAPVTYRKPAVGVCRRGWGSVLRLRPIRCF